MLKQTYMHLQDKALNLLNLIRCFCHVRNLCRRHLYTPPPPVEKKSKQTEGQEILHCQELPRLSTGQIFAILRASWQKYACVCHLWDKQLKRGLEDTEPLPLSVLPGFHALLFLVSENKHNSSSTPLTSTHALYLLRFHQIATALSTKRYTLAIWILQFFWICSLDRPLLLLTGQVTTQMKNYKELWLQVGQGCLLFDLPL